MKGKVIAEWLDNPKRLIAAAIIIVIAIVIIALLGKKIKNWIEYLKNKGTAKSDYEAYIASTGETPTLTDGELRKLIEKLEAAFNYRTWGFMAGTDEDAVFEVFNRMGNGADVRRLDYLYGTNNDGHTLSQELHDELSSRDIAKVNQILANKGINVQF